MLCYTLTTRDINTTQRNTLIAVKVELQSNQRKALRQVLKQRSR